MLQILIRFIAIRDYTMPRVCYYTLLYCNLVTVPYRTVPYRYNGLFVILLYA